MGLFSRKNKKEENLTKKENETIVLTREDGSIISLLPIMDKEGNHVHEAYYNINGEICRIPKYMLYCSELQQINPELLGTDILLDIQPEQVKDPNMQYAIANKLLASNRIRKVISDYQGYTGTIVNENGNMKKELDMTIVRQIEENKQKEAESSRIDREKTVEQQRKDFLKEIEAKGNDFYPAGSTAEQLTPEMKKEVLGDKGER